MSESTATPVLDWLDTTPAAERVRDALAYFTTRTAASFASLGMAGEEAHRAAVAYLAAGGAILELARQLVVDGRADPKGLQAVGLFLQEYPDAREHLLRQEFEEPNQTEVVRSIIARAQSAVRV